MVNFSNSPNPLGAFMHHIERYSDSISKVNVKHSEGNHGSDKGCCIWCGNNNPNTFTTCTVKTKEEMQRKLQEEWELKALHKIISRQSRKNQKLIFKKLNLLNIDL